MIKIIDNFLDEEEYEFVKKSIYNEQFPWYYSKILEEHEVSVENSIHNYFYIHTFYIDGNVTSNFFPTLAPILNKINPLSLLRIRANQYSPTPETVVHGMHTDMQFAISEETAKKIMVCVFYLDDSDGKTVFENGEEVSSKENRIVFFPGDLKHSSTSPTNMNRRNIININYIPR